VSHDVIICGGNGPVTGEKTITIYTHTRADIAIKVRTDGLTERKHRRLTRFVQRTVDELVDGIEEITGDGYEYHEPHSGNLP